QVRTRRQGLTQLDEGRPHLLEVGDEALGQRVGPAVGGVLLAHLAQVEAGHDAGAPVAREHRDDLGGAGKPLHGVVHVYSPLRLSAGPRPARPKYSGATVTVVSATVAKPEWLDYGRPMASQSSRNAQVRNRNSNAANNRARAAGCSQA